MVTRDHCKPERGPAVAGKEPGEHVHLFRGGRLSADNREQPLLLGKHLRVSSE